jgi:hypothetical protein
MKKSSFSLVLEGAPDVFWITFSSWLQLCIEFVIEVQQRQALSRHMSRFKIRNLGVLPAKTGNKLLLKRVAPERSCTNICKLNSVLNVFICVYAC